MLSKVFMFFLLLFTIGSNIFGQVIINKNTGRIMLGNEALFLKPNKEVSFQEVLKATSQFVKSDQEAPNLGFSKNSVWLKLTIINKTNHPDLLLEIAYPILDEVELFSPNSKNTYNHLTLGEIKRFDTRKYKHPNYIYDLSIPTHTAKTYYLRVKSAEQLIIPVSVNTSIKLWEKLNEENIISGIYLGAVLIMFLYNLFIFVSVRDRSYFYYVIYVAFVGLTQIGIKGYSFQYLWPNNSFFELKSVILFACISGIAALLFIKQFLHTKVKARKSDIVLTGIIFLLLIAFVLTCLGFEQIGFQLMQIATTLFAIAILTVSFIIMRTGYAPAKFVFFSWTVLLAGAIIFALKDNGILPYNIFTSYSMQGASAIEMALLSFGLADRINILKKEKEISQAEALASAKENERIIKEQNVFLEQKVKERTIELVAANNELSNTLEDLKQAQSQLVESEKMASLGQLTAGIAHEINNPINFVTSNVPPLKRDLGMLFDALEFIENVGLSDKDVWEKKKTIENYKEELDYNYLKIEIGHLLSGITDGANRTAEIVAGLRIFSRVDEDDLKSANINQGIDSTLIIMKNSLSLNNIEVEINYGSFPKIDCYPGKLNQVFLNIISNAIDALKYKKPENGSRVISIYTEADKDYAKIKIVDNGTGMSEIAKQKIFEPFFTTKEVGEGTGLGMSIVYNTIKKHNGEVIINSDLDKGTEITIIIPVSHQND